ncbi:HAD hydrolase family protein [Streptococcus gordonii]|uniref:HAD hydrolase family protein n=1 Tax=Streptococcus gordonii TaxID=1302 RepID=UPI001CBC07FC|nr:HAD hydrolase family protein [Streptococcus gordonii]MBZ2139624.1 HAD hydrolase family protein [Streptococcus gordonii]
MKTVKGLLVMDVDSTLIMEEGIDLLGEEAGVGAQVAAITERAMRGEIVTKDTKLSMLKAWAVENKLDLNQTIAMGDGANDLPMIQAAGIGIAFMAKPIVREQAPYQIQERNLYRVIDLLDNRKE